MGRSRKRVTQFAAFPLAIAAVLAASTSTALACQSEVMAELTKRGMGTDRMTKMDRMPIIDSSSIIALEYWVTVKGCRDQIVVNVDPINCRVKDSYGGRKCDPA